MDERVRLGVKHYLVLERQVRHFEPLYVGVYLSSTAVLSRLLEFFRYLCYVCAKFLHEL
jgi:hypothetical protein